ncbi:hypothetical protein A3J20_06015 [Candidatus Gottesmanbacteria bacterium RIFCSPLOWO2_02_FULL_42_29]|uniref:Uncharacterized protein n=2 Tax=Candidatus Gottesmaniibacteriota TaxID=1752720 RepID=A0A1F6BJZ3_9BACT|nr:MAG: Polysaccharide pyruvyl transferase CsaB [Candidatus Gottesmanbacteria bacterium GW2011_GWA2_42_18]OGG09691.1 MAG: hypothetical protein A2781_00750 [Candidatus Gottesmanbacteria bacterium RIFCSPHIGHO2_01_FULL_42_27]OGG22505.1 MAG: hypothetical protein A3E72_03590 [Candidatus Gottesmanbacteria bacterium RIFCSPHIGHO2_12_FULL_43_26]OGG32836.1 MAG: hypothetical protein A3G68_03420 [Candidatus Gottesmanbacteria bacterium RIFCSPLOWO2_12_FULL_42_10]OGG36570.1 MAG: hypothetical protein A3J20_060
MSQNTIKILGVKITTENEYSILEKIDKYFKNGKSRKAKGKSDGVKPLVIFTPNPEIVVFAEKNKTFRQTVNTGQINLPDGAGIVWAVEKKYKLKIRRISGVDFMLSLCRQAVKRNDRIGLIGGRTGLAVQTAECLRKLNQGLKIDVLGEPEIKIRNSEFEILNYNKGKVINSEKYFENLINAIEQRKIDVLFVALGFPKQEFFIQKLKEKMQQSNWGKPLVMMAVGGSFDYLSGKAKRAPKWLRDSGWEWAYRLVKEPWRLKRHLAGSVFFPQIYFRQH